MWRRARPLAAVLVAAALATACEDDPMGPEVDFYTVHRIDIVIQDTIVLAGDTVRAFALGIDTTLRGIVEYADLSLVDTTIAVEREDQGWYGYQDRSIIIGRTAGRTYLIASAGGMKDSVPIRVIFPLETIVMAPAGPLTMTVGDSVAITATPVDTSGATLDWLRPYWISYNTAVASVTRPGMVHARGPGVTTVTANVYGVEGRVTVTVNAAAASQ